MAQQQADRHGKAKAFRRRAKEVLVSAARFANRHLGEGGKQLDNELWAAAQRGDVAETSRLLKRGAKVDSANSSGETALHVAAENGHTEVCALLIQKGADVNARNEFNKTSLHFAATYGRTETCLLLIENGADVNAKDKHTMPQTATYYALQNIPHNNETAQLLAFAELLAAANKEAPAAFLKSFRACYSS